MHKASASSIEWVVKTIQDYFFYVATLEITSHINLLATGSIPVDGSSKNITFGLPKLYNYYLTLPLLLIISFYSRQKDQRIRRSNTFPNRVLSIWNLSLLASFHKECILFHWTTLNVHAQLKTQVNHQIKDNSLLNYIS